jgi:hypothetical protein
MNRGSQGSELATFARLNHAYALELEGHAMELSGDQRTTAIIALRSAAHYLEQQLRLTADRRTVEDFELMNASFENAHRTTRSELESSKQFATATEVSAFGGES